MERVIVGRYSRCMPAVPALCSGQHIAAISMHRRPKHRCARAPATDPGRSPRRLRGRIREFEPPTSSAQPRRNARAGADEGQPQDHFRHHGPTQDTGLLDWLVPAFEKETGYSVKTVAVWLGRGDSNGDAVATGRPPRALT